jgi:histidinol-phosphatase (PHP family)
MNLLPTDYHIHTSLCKHASGKVEEFVERAIGAGLREIAFTDHIPLPGGFDLRHRMAYHEMEIYQNWIYTAREKYPDITILLGIEADYYQGLEQYLERFLKAFDFDLIIMSVHFIPGWPPENWVFKYDFPDKSKSQIFNEYFSVLIAGIETGMFDILGHADIIKRPGESVLDISPDMVDRLMHALAREDMAIEINTSGIRKEVCETYPDATWLPLIKNQNVPVTTGSDAHIPDQIAFKFGELGDILKSAGIGQVATYNRRQRNYLEI